MNELCPFANVFALDIPHFKNEDELAGAEITLARLSQNLIDFMNHLCLDRVYLVGHGIGGLIALNFSILYPGRVVKIVIASVNPRPYPLIGSDWTYYINPELQQLLEQAIAPDANLKMLAQVINNLVDPIDCDIKKNLDNQLIELINDYRVYIKILKLVDFRSMVSQVTVPVLITVGTRDPYTPLGAAEFLRHNIPDSALVEFYNQGFNFPIFNSGLFNKNVFNFFFVKCDPCCAYLESIKEIKEHCKCECNKKKCKCNEKKTEM